MKAKDIKKFGDLYGIEIILPELNKMYEFVSFRRKSIPGPGSPTIRTSKYTPKNYGDQKEVINVILHKNSDITVQIRNFGFLRFSCPFEEIK